MSRTKAIVQQKIKQKPSRKKVVKEKPLPLSMMRAFTDIYYDFQQQRISTQLRINSNKKLYKISDKDIEFFGISDIFKDAEMFEKRLKTLIDNQLPNIKLYTEYFEKIAGIGTIISAGLLAHIHPIENYKNISRLWQMAGYGMNRYCRNCNSPTFIEVEYKKKGSKKKTIAKRLKPFDECPVCGNETTPVIQRRTIGYQSNWNPKLKSLLYLLASSFVKQPPTRSKYRKLYVQFKRDEKRAHPKKIKENGRIMYNDGHLHNRAMRRLIKVFLAHLWETWRKMEKLPVTKAYAGQMMSHDVIPPFTDKK